MAASRFSPNSDRIDHTPGTAVLGGTPVNLNGIIGYTDRDIAANEFGALVLPPAAGLRKYTKTPGVGITFAIGDSIYYDMSTGLAVQPGLGLDGSADLEVAICVVASTNAALEVYGIPLGVSDRQSVIRPFVYEFDCDGVAGDILEHVLVPAWMNRHGLLFVGAFGIVTEIMAGSSEDQGIITIEDEDDNVLSTITASNSAADAVNDVLIGTNDLYSATSGDAAKVIAAGKAIQGFVSQQTTGTPAGKIKVYVDVRPLV